MPVLDNDPFIVGDDAPTNRTPPSLTALHSDDIVVGPKPVTYYGEGPFDAPSSDSEEEDGLLDKDVPSTPGIAEAGNFSSSFGPTLVQKVRYKAQLLAVT